MDVNVPYEIAHIHTRISLPVVHVNIANEEFEPL